MMQKKEIDEYDDAPVLAPESAVVPSSAIAEESTSTAPIFPAASGSPLARCKAAIAWLKVNKKRFFWWWIAYQVIKGMLTTSLIWIPLIYMWVKNG